VKRDFDTKVLLDHMGKHAIHVVFMVTMLVAFRVADVPMSMITFMLLIIGSITMLEAGLWFLHRRDATVESN
jgi:hypothetical protein